MITFELFHFGPDGGSFFLGGGKSLCYQLPAVSSGFGFALVISPLISLMEDQKMALDEFGVNAEMLTASTSQPDVTRILVSCLCIGC